MKKRLAALTAALAVCAASQANAENWLIEANGVKADDLSGAELGLGYRLALGNFRLIPIVGALIHHDDNSRYREETFSNGQTVCRNTSNGQFAKNSNCDDVAAKAYGKLEAVYRFGNVAALGGGVRVSDKTSPYGTASFFIGERLALKGFGGKDYFGGGLTLAF